MDLRDLLRNYATEISSYDMTDFENECDEILKEYVYSDDAATEAENRSRLCGLLRVRNWLRGRAKAEFLTIDWADFRQDCSEILKKYVSSDDEAKEDENRNNLWNSLQVSQADKEYLSSLNLHRIIAKHVRIGYRNLESWVKSDSAKLNGLGDEIATAIRDAWKERTPEKGKLDPKFSEELRFHELDLFHLGLEELIGYPPTNLDFLDLMKQEHEQGTKFKDYKNRDVDPKVEWNIVMRSKSRNIAEAGFEPTTTKKRRDCEESLDFYINMAKEKFSSAGASEALIDAEVAALRLWTGPMYKEYAKVLREQKEPPKTGERGPYVTTLHALNSGITKLARIWPLPASRKVYRGYKNLKMKALQKDKFNCVGGVERSVLATTEDFNVAVEYSENDAFILEIDVGQVNRGADVRWLSQFPHQREILFNALSNVEFVSSPQQRFVEGCGKIRVYRVCLSANVKGKTLDQFVNLRKVLHLNLYREARHMISLREEGSRYSLIKDLGAECRKYCDEMFAKANSTKVDIFNKGTPEYVSFEEAAVMLPSRSLEIMKLALSWFENRMADPADVDRLQDWQLQALKTVFKKSERPEVNTIVLDRGSYDAQCFFRARSLKFGQLDTLCRVAKLLVLNPDLVWLKVGDVSAKAELFEKFCAEFCHCMPSLRVNGFHLAKYAISTLKQLDLRNWDDEMATMIAPVLQFHTPSALTSLSLWGSPIACTGAECLGRAFSALKRLRYVDLRSCQIACRGCTGISKTLPLLAELEDLNLAHNNVDDDGFNVIAVSIRTNLFANLMSVDMRFNYTQMPSLQYGPQCVIKNHAIAKLSTDTVVSCVAWSPDGGRIVSGSVSSMNIIIWDAKAGALVSTLKGHTAGVDSVAWSPWSNSIASASLDKTIILWDATTGEQISTLTGHGNHVTCVAWRPGGDHIASGARDNKIIIWDAKTGEQLSNLKGHSNWVQSVAWSPGGDQIASAARDDAIIVWDANTGRQISMLKGHTKQVYSVAWSSGGDQIASGSDDETIIIWDAQTSDQILTLKGHASSVRSVVWCPAFDQIASGSYDNTIIIWNAKTGDQVSTLKGHSNRVQSVAWSPEGDRVASGSTDETIIIWDAKSRDQDSKLKGHLKSVETVAWSPTAGDTGTCGRDQIASGSYDGTIIIWDANTGQKASTLKGHSGAVRSLAWHPGGDRIASGSYDKTIIIWDAKTGDQLSKLEGHLSWVLSVVWSANGDRVASGSTDKTIIIWNVQSRAKVTLEGHTEKVCCVAWSPRNDLIASGSADNSIIIWDTETRDRKATLLGHTRCVYCVRWSMNGDRIASCSGDRTILIWDANGKLLSTLTGHTGNVNSVAWSPNGQQVSSASNDNSVKIWDANNGALVSQLNGHSDIVLCVGWSATGKQVVSCSSDNTVIVWDVMTGEKGFKLEGHSRAEGNSVSVQSVVWSQSMDQDVSASLDQTLFLGDSSCTRQVSTLPGRIGDASNVATQYMYVEQANEGEPVASTERVADGMGDGIAVSSEVAAILAGTNAMSACDDEQAPGTEEGPPAKRSKAC